MAESNLLAEALDLRGTIQDDKFGTIATGLARFEGDKLACRLDRRAAKTANATRNPLTGY